jgi:ATP-dependent exoDNAse (exonuclease V) alpha subunit
LDKINENVKEFNLEEDGIFLTTTNRKVNQINSKELKKLSGREYKFGGEIDGNFPNSYLPTAKDLKLKKRARVMLLNNDKDGRWINGDIGEILEIDNDESILRVKLENGRKVKVSSYKWKRLKYKYNSKTEEVKSDEVGSFNQLPIRLAWATTIHKAQGKTFDRAMIDFQNGTFSHGQAYVALSRCTGLDGLSLRRPIRKSDIIVDQRVNKFLNSF